MGFLLGLAVGLFVGIASMLSMVLLNDVKDAGAWAQAIGGICAVAVAVYIPLRIRDDQRKAAAAERGLKTKALAIAIYPDIEHIQMSAVDLLSSLESEIKFLGDEVRDYVPAQKDARKLPIPPGMMRWHDQIYLLGEIPGQKILQLISNSEQLERDLRSSVRPGWLIRYADAALELCINILPELERIRDS
jgi:hypothetical protein